MARARTAPDDWAMRGTREPTARVHRVCDRGVIWRANDAGGAEMFTVTCAPRSAAEKEFWSALSGVSVPGYWSLSGAEADGESFRLSTVARSGVPLASWLGKMEHRPEEVTRLVEQTRGLLARIPRSLREQQTRWAASVLVTPAGSPLLAAVPWLQLASGEEGQAEEDPALRAFEARVLAGPGEVGLPAGPGGFPATQRENPEADGFPDAAVTAPIPRTRRSRRRTGPYLIVSFLTLAIVATLVGLRWHGLAARSVEEGPEATETEQSEQRGEPKSGKPKCPRRDDALLSLEEVLAVRASAIEDLAEGRLDAIESGALLESDRALVTRIRQEGWKPDGLSFPVETITDVRCPDGRVVVAATVGQSEFQQCQNEACEAVESRPFEPLVLEFSPDMQRILDVQRE